MNHTHKIVDLASQILHLLQQPKIVARYPRACGGVEVLQDRECPYDHIEEAPCIPSS